MCMVFRGLPRACWEFFFCDVQTDGEEDNERSERLFGYNPDSGDVWGEYQAVMGDPMLAW